MKKALRETQTLRAGCGKAQWRSQRGQWGSDVTRKFTLGRLKPLPFPSSPLPLPSPHPFPPLPPLEVGPQMQLGVWGSAVSSPSGVWGEPQPKSNLVHFSHKI